jgi:YVTN family beta-propeller protein
VLLWIALFVPTILAALNGYVANDVSNTLSVFDVASNKVVGTIEVGSSPQELAFTEDRIYVPNYGDNTVSVIDLNTNHVIDTIPVGIGPYYIGVYRGFIYVVNFGTIGNNGSITVIDEANLQVKITIQSTSFNGPIGIAFSRNYAYIPNFGNFLQQGSGKTVIIIDTDTLSVVETLQLGPAAMGCISVAVQGRYAYVANALNDPLVSVIDTYTNTLVGQITTPSDLNARPFQMAIANNHIYLSDTNLIALDVVDLKTNKFLSPIPLNHTIDNALTGIAILGNNVYITDDFGNNVIVYNFATGAISQVQDPLSTFNGPIYIAFPPITYDINRL